MTPERLAEIRTLHKMYSENLARQPQHAVNVLVDCVRDLTVDNDSLTAEIATLKGEVIQREFDLVRAGKTQETLERERDAALYDCATLRARLDALVTAGEDMVDTLRKPSPFDCSCDNGYHQVGGGYNGETGEEQPPDLQPCSCLQARDEYRQNIDALAAAVAEAKGEK